MRKHILFIALLIPLLGIGQTDNLKLIDDAEKKFLHDANWRYKHRHLFKDLDKLLNNTDTIYLHEVTKGNPDSYLAYIYTGNGNAIHLEIHCKGHPEKCGKPKLTQFKMPSIWSHGDYHEFPPCYYEWFGTFDTTFLHKLTEKQTAYAQIPCTVLVRIIKGQVSIYYTELHYNQVHDLRRNDIVCPDLNTKEQ